MNGRPASPRSAFIASRRIGSLIASPAMPPLLCPESRRHILRIEAAASTSAWAAAHFSPASVPGTRFGTRSDLISQAKAGNVPPPFERRSIDMKSRAAVAFAAGKPLEIVEVDLDGPKEGEVLIEVKATGICHTDEFTLSGADPEGIFPAILGHEGAGVVVDVGPGVASLKKGDHVIPLYTPECRQCPSCLSRKTNLCTAIRATQGQGLMPDGTSRFSLNGEKIFHYMGCSTFSNFTVLPEIAVA